MEIYIPLKETSEKALACVASVPVRRERIRAARPREGFFRIWAARKLGREQQGPRENWGTFCSRSNFRAARITGTLAAQAKKASKVASGQEVGRVEGSRKKYPGRYNRFSNPYPFYDQNLRNLLPYLRPDQKFGTLFMT